MGISNLHYKIFRKGSKTYFNSSVFFPNEVRKDVFVLYGFVRTADDFVDRQPAADADGFYKFKERYYAGLEGRRTGDPIVDDYIELANRLKFVSEWTEAFLNSMEMDLVKSDYDSLDETLAYIYGSAEVVGLFMAAVLGLPSESHHYAMRLGRAMQFINFIRDISEDLSLGRRYLPLLNTGPAALDRETAHREPELFRNLVRYYLSLYNMWQEEAEKGFAYIPKRYLIPIKTASQMYNWTARQIEKDPLIVFERKVKPSKRRILLQVIKNTVSPGELAV